MEIEFSDKKLEKILTNDRLMRRAYGKFYHNLKNRLSELIAANHLEMIPTSPPPRRHKLSPNQMGYWGICVSENYRIIIEAIGDFNPNDLKTIKQIKIIRIEDYH